MLGKTPLPRNFFKPKSRPVHCITLSARSLTRFVVHPFSRPFDVTRDDFGPKVTGLAEENGFEMAVASRQNSNVAHRTHQDRQLRFHREESGVAKFWREVLICYAQNLLSDEEFLVLLENFRSKNPEFL